MWRQQLSADLIILNKWASERATTSNSDPGRRTAEFWVHVT